MVLKKSDDVQNLSLMFILWSQTIKKLDTIL